MNESEKQAREVITALRSYAERIKEIQNLVCDKRYIAKNEKENLQILLTNLKQDLKTAAKRQTVNNNNEAPNEIEKSFFMSAVFQASSQLSIKVNSHPIQSNWHSHLYDALVDIDFSLSQLIILYPENN